MADDLWVVIPAGQRRDGGWIDDTLRSRGEEYHVSGRAPDAGRFARQRVELVRGPGAFDRLNTEFRRRGWTDGLPVMAPTVDKVADLVASVRRPPHELVAELAPLNGLATVEKIAANAVMAGAGPDQFPFVLAAVQAIAEPAFNLAGVQTTDENCAPLIIISAPSDVRAAAELHAGTGVLGPGWRGNATIGRAVRFVMANLGGGWPAAVSFAGAGHPGRYTLCAVEDDEACPWPPLRVDLGFAAAQSVLIVLRAESVVNVTGGLAEIISVMSSATSLFTAMRPSRAAVLLAPATAAEAASNGCSRADVAAELAERSSIDAALWNRSWLASAARHTAAEAMPVVRSAEELVVFVAGGRLPIAQQVWFPSWGFPPAAIIREVVPR